MSDTVEGLVIEIESSASGAISQLDALTQKLQGLKSSVSSSTPLKNFSKNYTELVNTVNSVSIDPAKLGNLNVLRVAMNGLAEAKVSSTMAKNITSLNTAVNSLDLGGLGNVMQYTNTLSQLSEIKISSTLPKRLNELAEFGKQIQGQNFSSLKEFTSALAQLSVLSNVNASSVKNLTDKTREYAEKTKNASERGRTFNTVLANIRVRTLALVRATQMITRVITRSLTVYGDYVETLNLFKMAMGEAAQESYEFAEKAQSLLGIDLTQWMKAQGVFNALATGFGVASDKAAIMSQNLTQLAYDISSFYNIDVETAIEKVQSGFAGQIRPVRDLGYDLSQARLETIALSLGIDKNVKSMTQAEKSQLRYIALLTQLKQVQGDLARTLDSPTNQMRILNAQLEQMYRAIGLTLLPILNKVLPYLNAVLRVIKMIATEIAALFGYTLPTITEESTLASVGVDVEDLEDDLEDATGAAEKLKNTLASFDQINLITSKSGGSGSGASVVSELSNLDLDLPTYDFLGDATENKAQQIAEGMMKKLRPLVDFIEGAIKYVVDNIDNIKQMLEILAVVTIGKKIIDKLKDMKKWAQETKELFGDVATYAQGIALVTIGFQFSYLGGKDMAKGDWLIGIVKSTIGAAATAIGMTYFFGPAGVVIGLTASLIMTFEGFRLEKVEQTRERIREAFYSLAPDGASLQDISDSWSHFIEQFTNTDLLEKDNVATETKKTVDAIGQAIVDLQANYETGVLTAEEYGQNLESMYSQMKDAVCKNLEAVNDAIETSLSGPLGLWLEAHGVSLEKLRQSMKFATQEIVEEMGRNEIALANLNKEYAAGVWTEEQYTEKLNEILGPLKAYYDATGKNVEATENFLTSFKNIKIDLTDYDSLVDTLEQVRKGYLDAKDQIDALEKADISNIEALLPFASPEDRVVMEEAIEQTKGYYEAQRRILNEGYGDLLNSFEEQGAFNWAEIYQIEGLEDTHDAMYEQMQNLDKIFSDMYGGAGLERNENYWKMLIGYMDEYEREAANGMASMEGWNQEYLDKFDLFSTEISVYNTKNMDVLKQLEKTAPDVYKRLTEKLNATTNFTSANTDKVERRMSDFDTTVSDIERREQERMMNIYGYTADAFASMDKTAGDSLGAMGQTVDAKMKMIGNIIIREDWCVDPMYKAMWDTAEVLQSKGITSEFSKNAVKLMGGVANDITGAKDNIQRAYNMSLTPTGNMIVDIGVGIGEQIRQGMLDSQGDVKDGATELTKGMAQAFNTFGDKAYKYFSDLANLGAVVLGGMGATVSDSTFNNKFKAPKIKGYATGGFPDSADFFYANENGVPEYVGTMGGRTAVANNTDIVKGVSDGVYRAIKDTGIQNDVKKIASKNGNVVFAPSAEAGKVMQQSVNMYNGTGGRY